MSQLEKIVKNATFVIMGALVAANVYMANYLYSKDLESFNNPAAINLCASVICGFFPYLLFHEDPVYKTKRKK